MGAGESPECTKTMQRSAILFTRLENKSRKWGDFFFKLKLETILYYIDVNIVLIGIVHIFGLIIVKQE